MKYILSVFVLFLSCSCFAQFDNEHYEFKRNTIRIGVGSINANNFPIQYRSTSDATAPGSRDFELEYERQLNKYFSAGILYKFVDYDLGRYIYKEHQRQVNFFYAPFNNFRRIQFKLGAGVMHSTVKQTNYFDYEISGLSFTRSTSPDYGFIGIAELNYTLFKNISIGVKGFKQYSKYSKNPYGGLLKLGYSF